MSEKKFDVSKWKPPTRTGEQPIASPQPTTVAEESNLPAPIPEVEEQALVELPAAEPVPQPVLVRERFPRNLPRELNLVIGQDGNAYSIQGDRGNLYALPLGSRVLNNIIRELGEQDGIRLRKNDLADLLDVLQADAERAGISREVWYRVAPIQGGIEIDLGDDSHARVRITAGC